MLLCTHDLHEARELTSRVAVLNQGRLVVSGDAGDVLDRGDPLELFRGNAAALDGNASELQKGAP